MKLAAVVSPASAPRLARVQSVDPGSFARRAHLQPGRPFTVVLRVKVMEDGLVSAADVVRTSDNPAADAAAIGYALELRWVPGTKNQNPETMAVSFPVTLVAPSETSRKSPCKSVRERCTRTMASGTLLRTYDNQLNALQQWRTLAFDLEYRLRRKDTTARDPVFISVIRGYLFSAISRRHS